MGDSKRERLTAIAAKSLDDGQAVIEGVAPVSLGERLSWMGAQPIALSAKQKPLDIGLWNPMRDQLELF